MKRYEVPNVSLKEPHCTELLIRRSRFVTHCAHTPDPQTARAFIEQIRRKYPDATHNCWAYAVGAPGDTALIGYSDDGEPHGTAGRPMLQLLLHGSVGEACFVVSRWFGGVKLGTGGLMRAYQESVRNNLSTLPVCQRVQENTLTFSITYAYLDTLRRILSAYEARIESEIYQTDVQVVIRLPGENTIAFIHALTELTSGSVSVNQNANQ